MPEKRNERHTSINLQELIERYSSGEYIVQNFKFLKEEFLLSLNRNQTLILVSVIEKKKKRWNIVNSQFLHVVSVLFLILWILNVKFR